MPAYDSPTMYMGALEKAGKARTQDRSDASLAADVRVSSQAPQESPSPAGPPASQ